MVWFTAPFSVEIMRYINMQIFTLPIRINCKSVTYNFGHGAILKNKGETQ